MSRGEPIPADVLSRTLAALADPTRRSILEQLSLGPATVSELSRPYPISQPAISKHLKVLEDAGLIARESAHRLGRRRLDLAVFAKAALWMESYARIWEVRLRHFTGEGAPARPKSPGPARASPRTSSRPRRGAPPP